MDRYEQDVGHEIGARSSSFGCWPSAFGRQEKCRSHSGVECFGVLRQTLEKNRPTPRPRWFEIPAAAWTAAQVVPNAKENADANSVARRAGSRLLVRFVDGKTPRTGHSNDVQRQLSSKSRIENPAPVGFHSSKAIASRTATGPQRPGMVANHRVCSGSKRCRCPLFSGEWIFLFNCTRRTSTRRF